KQKKEKERKEKLAKQKKEKERKERLAKQKKEKERKEKLAKQRNDEMERLKNSMSSLNITDINQGGNNDKTLAGVSNGSDDGQRIGEVANYSEQIRSKIRRKIVFDLTKIIENPRVVFKVIRKNGQYRQLEIVQRSGNPKWDFAVQDAIKQSIPLPDPPKEEIPIPPGELILTFTPRE
ncbi:MAG: protein TolA, partial [Proteobacteria bacterium]|nr:protein TolA [Pseudomonadota bacterium]